MKKKRIEYYLEIIGKIQDWDMDWDNYDDGYRKTKPRNAIRFAEYLVKYEKQYFK